MKIVVSWTEHDREYSIGIKRFLEAYGADVDDEKIKKTTRRLLEQQEMKPHGESQD